MATTPTEGLQGEQAVLQPHTPGKRAGITLRAWIIGLLLIPLLVFWVEYTEIVAAGPDLAAMSLPMAVVFALLVLIPINLLVQRWSPRLALTQVELMFIYIMNVIAVYISGIGMMQFLNPPLVGWSYFATKDNKWATSWSRYIRHWAVVNDPAAIKDYYAGRTTLFTPEHLAAWAVPITVWTGFILVLVFCFYCIATLVRRQWIEREKLIFPIVQIPLEITRDGGNTPLWRNRLLWIAVAISAVLESLASIHYTISPTFPYVPIKPSEPPFNLGQYPTQPPWNAIGYTTVSFFPLVIGLTYLLSLDVSFSCWFFYLFTKIESVAATALGFRDPGAGPALSRMPYAGEQGVGAFVGLALFSLWLARPYLRETFRHAFRGDKTLDDRDEPMSFRTAYVGLLVSSVLLVGFAMALGLSLTTSLLFWGLFLLLALTFTRIRAEAGLPWGQGPYTLSHATLVGFGGTQAFTGQEMTGFSFLRWFDADWRCLTQPAEIEAMKIADSTGPRLMNPRHLTLAIFVAVVWGSLASWGSSLGIYYHYGAASAKVNDWRTGQGHYAFDELQGWLNNLKPVDSARIGGAVVGFIIVSLLSLLRTQFTWWPLHPIGYAVGNTDTMTWIWFPMLLGWLFKKLILRYGGIKIYRQALPFFIGLVLGDYASSGLWALYFLTTGHAGYRTFPI